MALPAKPAYMHQAVYEKIAADTVTELSKIEVLQLCEHCDAELGNAPTSVESVFNTYCAVNLASGAAVALEPGEIVGHIKLLDATSMYLSRVLGIDRDRVRELFQWLAGNGSPSQIDEARGWFADMSSWLDPTGNRIAISRAVCWLFRADATADANDLFQGAPECLPCRLGLPTVLYLMPPYPRNLDFLGMCIDGASITNPRAATVFHGDYVTVRDIWLPGGFTQPIPLGPPNCVAMGGVREFVADPPAFAKIDPFVRMVTT